MVVAFVLLIVGLLLALVGVATLNDRWASPGEAVAGVFSVIVGIVLIIGSIISLSNAQSAYDEETNRLCDKKNGVVTKDNHCFVDDKPVEFSPGVWQR